MANRRPRRTAALTLTLTLGLLVGCATPDEESTEETTTTDTSTTVATTTTVTTTTTTAPPVAAFTVDPNEAGADPKAAAVRLVEASTNHEAGQPRPALDAALATTSDPTRIAGQLDTLASGDTTTRGEVIYPQLGGLTATRSSVMVVARILTLRDDAWTESTRTLDVRVDLINGSWQVVDVASTGGAAPTAPPPPSPELAALLANPRVTMSDTTRWDLMAGGTDPRVVALINTLAERHTMSLSVLATGHPAEVFGTSSVSNHTRGRAVDIWEVDGRSVFESRDDAESGARLVVEAAVSLGATEVGSPWDLDGPGGTTFTNALHQDHLHLAFD